MSDHEFERIIEYGTGDTYFCIKCKHCGVGQTLLSRQGEMRRADRITNEWDHLRKSEITAKQNISRLIGCDDHLVRTVLDV
jgi:hypothetical protein